MEKNLDPLKAERKTGKESFHKNGESLSFDLLDFWQWFGSDLINNTTRGFLAEYLVSKALNNTNSPRVEWDAYDASTENGIKVEVKSASYIQAWRQKNYSRISFRIPKTRAWNAKENTYTDEKQRQADAYVFCLLNHKDQETLNALDLSQWSFFIISTEELDRNIGNQQSLSLSSLKKIGAKKVTFKDIASTVEQVANN